MVYDKSGLPVHLSGAIPDTPKVTYGYMTGGDRMRVKNVNVGNGTVNQNIEYDVEGRVSQVRQTFAGREDYSLDADYLWDTLSRIKEVRYPKQYGAGDARKVVAHNYDIASRLTELKFGVVTMASAPVYNSSNQMTSLAVGSEITENYSFDPKTGLLLSQQVNKGPNQLVNLQYNYTLTNDSNNNGAKTGQLTSVTDQKNTARNRAYEYDKLGRLGKVKGGVDAFSNPAWYQNYAYDQYGNRTGVTKIGAAPQIPLDGLASLGFNTANNRINADDFLYDEQQCQLHFSKRLWENFDLQDAAFFLGYPYVFPTLFFYSALPFLFEIALRADKWDDSFSILVSRLEDDAKRIDVELWNMLTLEAAQTIVRFLEILCVKAEKFEQYEDVTVINRTLALWKTNIQQIFQI